MLQELLHIHLVHDIERVFSLSHMQNWFTHEFVEHEDIILLLKVDTQGSDEIRLQKLALRNQGVYLLLLDLPADPINQQSQLDSIEGVDNWVLPSLFMYDLLVDID